MFILDIISFLELLNAEAKDDSETFEKLSKEEFLILQNSSQQLSYIKRPKTFRGLFKAIRSRHRANQNSKRNREQKKQLLPHKQSTELSEFPSSRNETSTKLRAGSTIYEDLVEDGDLDDFEIVSPSECLLPTIQGVHSTAASPQNQTVIPFTTENIEQLLQRAYQVKGTCNSYLVGISQCKFFKLVP